jgi:hypothetical protein
VGDVEPDDVIYHWNAREHRFVGRSIVASPVQTIGSSWIVQLEDFRALRAQVNLERLRSLTPRLTGIRDRLTVEFGHPLYLPFQYRSDGLRMMSNYFAKLPAEAMALLFDETGLGEAALPAPKAEDGDPIDARDPAAPKTGFLAPFRPKADTEYLATLEGGVRRRGRRHETLVNSFAEWLTTHGLEVGRNAAIDLGTVDPPVIIEAKMVGRWEDAIRVAVGQLYEYRFFRVANPNSSLIFLASEEVPREWVNYLEQDRQIGSAWPEGGTFRLSPLAGAALEFDRPRSLKHGL